MAKLKNTDVYGDLEVFGNIEVVHGNLIISSPNGTKYRLTVDNSGVLGTTAL